MIHIPDNLPLQIAPLTWLLGTWQGWGVFTDTPSEKSGEPITTKTNHPASNCLIEYDIQVVDEQLRLRRTIWRTQPGVVLDNEASVATGVNALEKTSLAWQTLGFWQIQKHSKFPEGVLIQATSASNTGNISLWQGTAKGPRVQLTLDVSAAAPQSRTLEYGQLMLGVAESDLFLVESLQFTDSEITLSGRLAKVAQVEPIELLPDGPKLAGVIDE